MTHWTLTFAALTLLTVGGISVLCWVCEWRETVQ